MHIFSLCIIDEPRSASSLNLGADHRVMHILSLMTIFIYCLLIQNMLFVTFLCVSVGVTKVVENEYYYRKFSK